MLNLATLPGPGDAQTLPPCVDHPNDPRTPPANYADTRAQIANDLRHALVRGHYVRWNTGRTPELAADTVHQCGQGNAGAATAFRDLHAALANGADAATVARLAREYHRLSFDLAVDDLTDAAMDCLRITFPVRGAQ